MIIAIDNDAMNFQADHLGDNPTTCSVLETGHAPGECVGYICSSPLRSCAPFLLELLQLELALFLASAG